MPQGPFSRSTAPNTAVVAPGANRAGWVFFGGLALIAVNFWRGGSGQAILGLSFPIVADLMGQHAAASEGQLKPGAGRQEAIDLGLQLGMLLILVLVASASDAAGSLALLFVVALWVVFLINTFGQKPTPAPAGGSSLKLR